MEQNDTMHSLSLNSRLAPMQHQEDDGQMTFRLIDGGWEDEFREALRTDASELRIICPL